MECRTRADDRSRFRRTRRIEADGVFARVLSFAFEGVQWGLSRRCEFFLQREGRYQSVAALLAGGVADVEAAERAFTGAGNVRRVAWNRLTG